MGGQHMHVIVHADLPDGIVSQKVADEAPGHKLAQQGLLTGEQQQRAEKAGGIEGLEGVHVGSHPFVEHLGEHALVRAHHLECARLSARQITRKEQEEEGLEAKRGEVAVEGGGLGDRMHGLEVV